VVRIGIFSSLASGFLAKLIQTYEIAHSGVRLEFTEGGPPDHMPAIRQHHLDVAFLTGMPSATGCEVAHLWNERVYVAMSESDELAYREENPYRRFRFSSARLCDIDIASNAAGDIVEIRSALVEIR
jgi:DNA-binding transcriptional LysR family regulator